MAPITSNPLQTGQREFLEETLQKHQVRLVFSVRDRLRFVWKILMVHLRETEREEREEISRIHIVHKRREKVVKGGHLHMVSRVERGVRARKPN